MTDTTKAKTTQNYDVLESSARDSSEYSSRSEPSSLSVSKSSTKSYLETTYEKIRTVGKGAFGTAVLYRRLSDSKMIVLKEINMGDLSAAERQMALNEVEVLSVLHHPNIISYLGSFEADGMLVIEMEYADGGTLSQYISRAKSPIHELEILSLFKQIVSAIQYMHEHNILHRDLKTANIFLTKDELVKIGDFGISKVMNTKSQAHTVLGTPYYISPEMCEGKQYDQKSDMWALGCILYELACREKTFQGSNLPALVNKIMKGSYEPLPTIYSTGLKIMVSDLLQKEPAMRPPASVVASRVSQLYERVKAKQVTANKFNAFIGCSKERSVLYISSGSGSTFSLVPVKMPPKNKIADVAISSSHSIALTSDMLVYTWGEGKRGQLVLESLPEWVNEPTLSESLMSKSVKMVAAGNGFSIFLSESGMVLSVGDGTTGCLGHGDWESLDTPRLIESLLNEDVAQISCSENHVVALTRDGKVYSWGTLPLDETPYPTPQELAVVEKLTPCSAIAGPEVTGIITKCGKLLVIGKNDSNRLGLNSYFLGFTKIETEARELTRVRNLEKWFVKSVSFGRSHTAVLTSDGYVITMGSNTESQLGHTNKHPSVVSSVADKVITMVVCGPTYTAVGSEENAVYFWGTRFTQGTEATENELRVSMTTLETQVVPSAQEILVLHASPSQIKLGRVVTLQRLIPLWHCMFVLVDTTAPLPKLEQPKSREVVKQVSNETDEYDSLGPIPDWIKDELAQATDEWPGESQMAYKPRAISSHSRGN
ncbi:NIMA-related kinase [Nesidiocoris tenuis]|uniref:non-specific serine/threonine protein kinase n=1 Tax=Nesidiocoris tenuis TaxID=355587 RepID=A0ABN7AW48_9HEMI|nr:NIMA-related kinase [Nesidiocoris tenuis]